MRGVKCGVWNVKRRVPSGNREVQSVECRVKVESVVWGVYSVKA